MKMKNIYIRFDNKNDYIIWLECLTNAIQQAKDQSWSKTNELVIWMHHSLLKKKHLY